VHLALVGVMVEGIFFLEDLSMMEQGQFEGMLKGAGNYNA
jgi:hypothetical protein